MVVMYGLRAMSFNLAQGPKNLRTGADDRQWNSDGLYDANDYLCIEEVLPPGVPLIRIIRGRA
jgi:hypothetical protein